VKLSDTTVQIGDRLVALTASGGGGQIPLPGGTSVLYAMVRVSGPGSASYTLAYDPVTSGGLDFPVPLYRLDSAGRVLCDYRGVNVVMYS